MKLSKKSILSAAVVSLGVSGLLFAQTGLADGWCDYHNCSRTKVVKYRGCRKIVRVRKCFDRHGYRHCRIVRKVRWVC